MPFQHLAPGGGIGETVGEAEKGRRLERLIALQEAISLERHREQVGREEVILGLSGGVANNRRLRERLAARAQRERVAFLPSRPEHTGDNAGMIAFAAWADPDCRLAEFLQVVPGLALEGT